MARRCAYCGKQPVSGNKISHSNIKTRIRFFPNLQRVRAFLDGINQRVYACTRCIRSGSVTKPAVTNRDFVAAPVKAEVPEAAVAT